MNVNELNVLLADDDTDDCTFFKTALAELSIPVNLKLVHDGEQLMNYLSENSDKLPTILFLDLNMPRKNGVECLTEIIQHEKLKAMPVVMFSTFYSKDTINMLFKIGARVYIRKTSDLAQLKQVIHHAIGMATEKILSSTQLRYILNA